jgi:hypothetical protein
MVPKLVQEVIFPPPLRLRSPEKRSAASVRGRLGRTQSYLVKLYSRVEQPLIPAALPLRGEHCASYSSPARCRLSLTRLRQSAQEQERVDEP